MRVFPDIDSLRARVSAIGTPVAARTQALSFGSTQADAVLGERLLCGRMHEFGGAAATLFATLVLARTTGPVLWCAHAGGPSELYPPGLAQIGLDPDRLVLVRLWRAEDLLHAAHEGLRAAWHVVLEAVKPLDLSAARRLQLAAEAGGRLGFTIASGPAPEGPLLPSAVTRWQISTAEGSPWPAPFRLHLHLLRNRSGLPGQWTMEWDHASRSFSLVPTSCDRQDRAPGAVSA